MRKKIFADVLVLGLPAKILYLKKYLGLHIIVQYIKFWGVSANLQLGNIAQPADQRIWAIWYIFHSPMLQEVINSL